VSRLAHDVMRCLLESQTRVSGNRAAHQRGQLCHSMRDLSMDLFASIVAILGVHRVGASPEATSRSVRLTALLGHELFEE
jgi:hypothetical protein